MSHRLLAALVAASTLWVAPVARADAPAITIRAARSGYVDVTFPTAFSLNAADSVMLLRRGTVGGFWAERTGEAYDQRTSNHFGYLVAGKGDRLAVARIGRTPETSSPPTYEAGRYRFHVVADGAFTLVLPVASGLARPITLSPTRNVTPVRVVGGVGADTGAGTFWEAREQVVVPARRTVAISLQVTMWEAGAHDDLPCFAAPGAECVPASVANGYAGVGSNRGSVNTFAGPGTLAAGHWDAVQRTVAAPGIEVDAVYGWGIVVDAPAA